MHLRRFIRLATNLKKCWHVLTFYIETETRMTMDEELRTQKRENPESLLASCRERYNKGGREAAPEIMEALNILAREEAKLPIPEWLKAAFIQAYNEGKAAHDWNAAFGKPDRSKHLTAAEAESKKSWHVYMTVLTLRAKKPKPKDITGIVAEKFDLSRATAKRYFEARRKDMIWAEKVRKRQKPDRS